MQVHLHGVTWLENAFAELLSVKSVTGNTATVLPSIRSSPQDQANVTRIPIKSAFIRLSTNDQLEETEVLRISHRVDIAAEDYGCNDCEDCKYCGARASGEDVILPQGKQAHSVLLRITFNKEQHIVQKHYTLQVYTGDAKVNSRQTVVTGSEQRLKRLVTEVYAVSVVEISGWLKDQNDKLRNSSIFNRRPIIPSRIKEIFNHASQWLIGIISVLVVGFVAGLVKTCIDEHRTAGNI